MPLPTKLLWLDPSLWDPTTENIGALPQMIFFLCAVTIQLCRISMVIFEFLLSKHSPAFLEHDCSEMQFLGSALYRVGFLMTSLLNASLPRIDFQCQRLDHPSWSEGSSTVRNMT